MRTMTDYTIYCTDEQIRKALELGAPIEFQEDASHADGKSPIIPTAEQMIGWLDEQNIFIRIDYDFHESDKPYKCEMCLFSGMTLHCGWFISHEEATLTAIDKALDYLIKNKKYTMKDKRTYNEKLTDWILQYGSMKSPTDAQFSAEDVANIIIEFNR